MSNQQEEPGLIKEIRSLGGNNPKFMGYDYFHVIYATGFALILSMLWVAYIFDDDMIRKMVLG